MKSLEPHLPKLEFINISKNKIGFDGAKTLAEILPKMTALKDLDVSVNAIGDLGICEIMKGLYAHQGLLSLNIGNNAIGKSSGAQEAAKTISSLLMATKTYLICIYYQALKLWT